MKGEDVTILVFKAMSWSHPPKVWCLHTQDGPPIFFSLNLSAQSALGVLEFSSLEYFDIKFVR